MGEKQASGPRRPMAEGANASEHARAAVHAAGRASVVTLLAVALACRAAEHDLGPPSSEPWVPSAHARTTPRIGEARPDPPVVGAVGEQRGTADPDFDVGQARFDLPATSGAFPIGLEQVLRVAGSEALRLRVAQEDAKAAEAEEQLVLDTLLPTLHLRSQFTFADGQVQNTAGEFIDVESRQNTFLGPAAKVTFDPAVAIFRTDEAAERAEAFAHGVRATANDVLRDAAFLYFDLVEAYALVEIAQRSMGNYDELVAQEEARVGSGASLQSNLLRAQARLARARQELVSAEEQVGLASSALVELLRMDPHAMLAPADEVLETVELVADAPVDELVARGLQRRPEMHQAHALHNAAAEGEDFWQKRWMVPRLDVLAQYGGLGYNLGDLEEHQYYEAGLTWDFAVSDRSERARARAAQRRASFTKEAVIRAVSREVVDAYDRVASARDSIASSADEVEKAQEVFDLLSVRYENGAADQVEVLLAELELTRSQVFFVQALTRYNRAQYDLFRATGGGEL